MEEHTSIYAAINAVMQEVGYVQKTGSVSFGKTNYKYAGEADLIAALRPAMVKHGVMISCKSIQDIQRQSGYFQALYTYEFKHITSDTGFDVPAIGAGVDSGDKAPYKAATGALKYALRQTFLIETGDDPDNVSSEELEAQRIKEQERIKKEREAEKEKWRVDVVEHDGAADWPDFFAAMLGMLGDCKDIEDCRTFYQANKKSLNRMKEESNKSYKELHDIITAESNKHK